MNEVTLFLLISYCYPLPLIALIAVIAQRRRLREERRQFATLKRISRGSRF